MKHVPPSVRETAFNCAHCGALAKQSWFDVRAKIMGKDDVPEIIDAERYKRMTFEHIEVDFRETERAWAKDKSKGRPFFGRSGHGLTVVVDNMWISRCYNCNDISLWINDRPVYPQRGEAPPVNPDTPVSIRRDYDEASSILDLSPRGAAALIRLSIQKICIELGQPGKKPERRYWCASQEWT